MVINNDQSDCVLGTLNQHHLHEQPQDDQAFVPEQFLAQPEPIAQIKKNQPMFRQNQKHDVPLSASPNSDLNDTDDFWTDEPAPLLPLMYIIGFIISLLFFRTISLRSLPFPLPLSVIRLKRTLSYLVHPIEFITALKFALRGGLNVKLPNDVPVPEKWCYQKLTETSRSFSAVILSLHEELKMPICIFYLVLRGLDTIEDDMKPKVEDKVRELRAFHTHLRETGWNIRGYGDKKEEIELLEGFENVIEIFQKLKPKYQNVIQDICHKMGDGMADFLTKKVESHADYELYCHYVAGLVGHGLSKLFGQSGLEDPKFEDKSLEDLSNSLGLFLQKTNIIRDFLEDISDVPPRIFWPKEIWSKHAENLNDFKLWSNREAAVTCLNEMVADALKHCVESVQYIRMIKEVSILKFVAIPQVMAISTLSLLYDNHDVFRTEVKIRKGEAVELILNCDEHSKISQHFLRYTAKLKKKVLATNTNNNLKTTERILTLLGELEESLQ